MKEKNDAIERAAQGAGSEWMRKAVQAIARVARRGKPFTSYDVRLICPDPKEPRAWGAAFKEAANDGIIVATPKWVPTNRVTSHNRPMRVWRAA